MKLPLAKDNVLNSTEIEEMYKEHFEGRLDNIARSISNINSKLSRYFSFDETVHKEVDNRLVKALQDAGYKVKHEGTQYKVSW